MTKLRSTRLFECDIERFWPDNEASLGKPFSIDKPQVPLGFGLPATCIWDELNLPMPEWADTEVTNPYQVDLDLRKRYNEKSMKVIGKTSFPEDEPPPADASFPPVKGITDIFESPVQHVGGTQWVMEAAHTPAELESLLDRVEKRELRGLLFPSNWESEAKRIYEKYGIHPRLGGHVRGPVTAATSIYGVENLIMLIFDIPALAERFSYVLGSKIIEMTETYYEVCGTPDKHGFSFADDNCCMLNEECYALFGQPILRRVFGRFAPGEEDSRYQHSDSAMGHLMPLLNEVGLNGANFGPTVKTEDIRKALPRCVIYGQLAPWTLARGTDQEVANEVKRDIEAVGADGGLVIATAGSVNPGSLLSGLRAAMSMIQQYGRYQPL